MLFADDLLVYRENSKECLDWNIRRKRKFNKTVGYKINTKQSYLATH